jgi:bifunctional non-homologous end joining protein LigD
VQPMLATANDDGAPPPVGDAWMHEVKWDGMRVLADVSDGRLRLTSRNGNVVGTAYPELVVGDHLPADALLDGEIVTLDGGLPSFATLAGRMHVRNERRARELAERHPVTFMAFDVLRLYGVELLTMPQEERRGVLDRIELGGDGDASHWRTPPAYDDGAVLWTATKAQGLEGVVSKRRTATYRPGRRTKDWIKSPHRRVESYAVVGWNPQVGTQSTIGSVWVASPDGAGGWVVAGRVGSGIAGPVVATLTRLLTPLARDTCPLPTRPPDPDIKAARWVEPRVVIDVRHIGHQPDGRIRQPVFKAVRTDLAVEDLEP